MKNTTPISFPQQTLRHIEGLFAKHPVVLYCRPYIPMDCHLLYGAINLCPYPASAALRMNCTGNVCIPFSSSSTCVIQMH